MPAPRTAARSLSLRTCSWRLRWPGPNRVYAFLEDIAPGDGDFDDMVVRIDLSQRDEPNQNHAPVAANVTATAQDSGPAVTVTASYVDADVGDTHTFLVDTTTYATKGTVINNGDGTFTYNPNGASAT